MRIQALRGKAAEGADSLESTTQMVGVQRRGGGSSHLPPSPLLATLLLIFPATAVGEERKRKNLRSLIIRLTTWTIITHL